jgi:integrase/recombinase XerD
MSQITEDFVSRVLQEVSDRMTGINLSELRVLLDDTVDLYDIKLKEGISSSSDLPEKIDTYLRCRALDGLSKSTISNYRYHLSRFATFVDKRVSTITVNDIRAFLSDLSETRHVKSTTLEGEKSILKAFFSWLEDEEYIKKSPARKIRPTKVEKRTRKSLSLEELELIRDACITDRERCMLELFYSTGMRLAELARVNVDDLNWADNSIVIVGKGNKERTVYFSEKAKVYIKKYLVSRGSFESSALFITSKAPHERLGGRSIEKEIGTIADRAKLDKHIFPHLLRHSFATQGSRSGRSLITLQNLMGHSKLDTTMVYVDEDRETAQYEHKKYLNQ